MKRISAAQRMPLRHLRRRFLIGTMKEKKKNKRSSMLLLKSRVQSSRVRAKARQKYHISKKLHGSRAPPFEIEQKGTGHIIRRSS